MSERLQADLEPEKFPRLSEALLEPLELKRNSWTGVSYRFNDGSELLSRILVESKVEIATHRGQFIEPDILHALQPAFVELDLRMVSHWIARTNEFKPEVEDDPLNYFVDPFEQLEETEIWLKLHRQKQENGNVFAARLGGFAVDGAGSKARIEPLTYDENGFRVLLPKNLYTDPYLNIRA